MMRAGMSATPPDENGTTHRTGFTGHAWQKAVIGNAAVNANAAAANAARLDVPASCAAPAGAVRCFGCSMRISIRAVAPTAFFVPELDVGSIFPTP
jgi:hypothetical protein